MNLYYPMIIERDYNNTFIVRFPDLPGCLTNGKTIEEAIKNSEDAKLCWFSACLEDNITIPEPSEKLAI